MCAEGLRDALLSPLAPDYTDFYHLIVANRTTYLYSSDMIRSIRCEPRHGKTNKMSVRPAKTQISLGIPPVRSESSLSAWRNLGSLATSWTHSEDSVQTGRMLQADLSLRWAHTHFVGFVMSWLNRFLILVGDTLVQWISLALRCMPFKIRNISSVPPPVTGWGNNSRQPLEYITWYQHWTD